jgi:type IV pilus biogenesis protein PilP
LFVKPAMPSDYANKLMTPGANQNVPQQQVGPAPVSYVVISVSMQMNRWTAVLGYQGKLYNVSVGDVLPMDGWSVQSISREGVILKKDNDTRKISLVPAI